MVERRLGFIGSRLRFFNYKWNWEQILGLDREELLGKVKEWYNGYSWDGKTFVYNPFSVLSFFQKSDFQNFWFSTGTPTFLIQQLTSKNSYQLGEPEVGQVAFESFDIQYLGQFIDAEVNTSDGRIDAVVQTETHVYVLAFKLDERADAALDQIREKGYADKYKTLDQEVLALGINFSSESKSVNDWKVEKY